MDSAKQLRELADRQVEKQMDPIRKQLMGLVDAGRPTDAVKEALKLFTEIIRRDTRAELERAIRKSEQFNPEQLAMLIEAAHQAELEGEPPSAADVEAMGAIVAAGLAETEDETPAPEPGAAAKPKTPQRGRQKIPAPVPRHPEVLRVPDEERACPICGEQRPCIGWDLSEVLELARKKLYVIEYQRETCACSTCKTIVMGPVGERVYDRGLAGPELLAYTVVSKYAEHTPLNRLAVIIERMGAPVAASTLGSWVARVADDLAPLVDVMWQELMKSVVVQTDATGLRVLRPPTKEEKEAIKKEKKAHPPPAAAPFGTMWCYVGDRKLCVFRYANDGTGLKGPWKYLAEREGYIQVDAANIYDRLFTGPHTKAIEVGCLAHSRRKFHKLVGAEPRAAIPIGYIAQVYRIEKDATAKGLSQEKRRELRQRLTRPVLDQLHKWLLFITNTEPPASALAAAAQYSVNHWAALTRFVDDGRLGPDNNFCELQIRSVAVGRLNYLFVGSDDAGHRAAVLYSLMRTCALNKVDPQAWLADVLIRLGKGGPGNDPASLLPHRWAQQSDQQPKADAT